VRHIDIDETTRTDAEGQPVIQRRIRLRLLDPLSALRLDDILERRGQPTASSFRYPNPHPASREYSFNLLRDKTLALDDALQTIEDLKKALAQAADREFQLTTDLAAKDRQLKISSHVEAPDHPSQGDTGCQPVVPKPFSPIRVKDQPQPQPPAIPKTQPLEKLPYHELPRRKQEIENARGSMGPGAFGDWLKATSTEPPGYREGAPRPPPQYDPMSFSVQGRCKVVEESGFLLNRKQPSKDAKQR
jgi:hypothetical protein